MSVETTLDALKSEMVRIHCPIRGVIEVAPPDVEEIAPLVAHLQSNQAVRSQTAFPRGTVMEDGRLDLCKQSLGALGCRLVTEALAHNTTISSLLLGTDGIGDGGAGDVARLIARNPNLKIVYLGCNFIGEAGAAQIADALTANTSVTGLWLKRNLLGTAGAKHIARMLRHNRTIRTLDLVNTEPGEEGLDALLDALIHANRTVERLYLGGNRITPSIAHRLGELVRCNSTLNALLLNVNHLEDEGASLLADGLQHNHTLQELELASNGISAAGTMRLSQALRQHPTLTVLDLGYSASTQILGAQANHLGDTGAAPIGDWLALNPPLRRLNLRGNGIQEAGRDALRAGLESNTNLLHLALDGKPDDKINALLQRNRTQNPGTDIPYSQDTALIRSVYRTL